jgi:predicted GIY-YIG superfamily endonuclease
LDLVWRASVVLNVHPLEHADDALHWCHEQSRTAHSQHKKGHGSEFTSRYHFDRLVYFEQTPDIRDAIAREKVLKGWSRKRKIELVKTMNPTWSDLSADWLE